VKSYRRSRAQPLVIDHVSANAPLTTLAPVP